jgi:hypothetical protein
MNDENILKIPFKESLTDIISDKKKFPIIYNTNNKLSKSELSRDKT